MPAGRKRHKRRCITHDLYAPSILPRAIGTGCVAYDPCGQDEKALSCYDYQFTNNTGTIELVADFCRKQRGSLEKLFAEFAGV